MNHGLRSTYGWCTIEMAVSLIVKYVRKFRCLVEVPGQKLTKYCTFFSSFSGIRKAVRHARMAHGARRTATKWPIIKILTGPVMRPDRTKLVKYKLFCEKDFNL